MQTQETFSTHKSQSGPGSVRFGTVRVWDGSSGFGFSSDGSFLKTVFLFEYGFNSRRELEGGELEGARKQFPSKKVFLCFKKVFKGKKASKKPPETFLEILFSF